MFIDEDFLLTNDTARRLYHDYAKGMPIVDYHCHLEPKLIADNYRFQTITELWLEGDHYKWRAMRANGIAERLITGEATDWEKFEAWAETVESLLGNALYHWTHLELKTYFGITQRLSKQTARAIYDTCNDYLATHNVTTQSLIRQSNVKFIGTTDDILSELADHQRIQEQTDLVVAPSFRPDPILNIRETLADYIHRCRMETNEELASYQELFKFLKKRIQHFATHGCRSADHGFKTFLFAKATATDIERIYQKALRQESITDHEMAQWQGFVLADLGREYAKYDWVMQLHFGVVRNNNTRLYKLVGENIGTDGIYDQPDVAVHLNRFLDCLDQTNQLPKTVVYNLNPTLNDVVANVCANFQANDQGIKSKVQFGAAWWFGDTYRGMRAQLETLSDHGILMNFIGMLTDSRSFLSYTRHDYFRRILCQLIGQHVESGFYPDDEELLKQMVQKIAYENVVTYFALTTNSWREKDEINK